MKFRPNRRVILLAALVVVGLLTVNFAVRGFQHAQQIRARAEVPVQAWMNVPFIARTYGVPPRVLDGALGITSGPDRRPLWQIAQDQGRSPDELIKQVTAVLERERPGHRRDQSGDPTPTTGSQP